MFTNISYNIKVNNYRINLDFSKADLRIQMQNRQGAVTTINYKLSDKVYNDTLRFDLSEKINFVRETQQLFNNWALPVDDAVIIELFTAISEVIKRHSSNGDAMWSEFADNLDLVKHEAIFNKENL